MTPLRILFAVAVPAVSLLAAETPVATAQDATPAAPAEKPAAVARDVSVNPPKKATEKEISPAEIDALLAKLTQMRGGLDAEARRAIGEALKALAPASAENTKAVSLYTESVRAVDYDKEKADKTQTGDFDSWRKQNDDRLHDAGFASAMRIRYRYLKLCLECDTVEKAVAAFPAIAALQADAIAALATSGQYASTLRDDVSADPVARRFKVEKYKPEGWSGSALDLGGHFGRAVKTAVETSPDSVPAIWEARLKLERALAEATDKNNLSLKRKRQQEQNGRGDARRNSGGGRSHGPGRSDADAGDDAKSVADFETNRLPRLLWAMAEDYLKAGLRRRGFESMFTIIVKYPKHPDVSDWVDRMTELATTLKEGGDVAAVESTVKTPGADNGGRAGRKTRR